MSNEGEEEGKREEGGRGRKKGVQLNFLRHSSSAVHSPSTTHTCSLSHAPALSCSLWSSFLSPHATLRILRQ